MNNQVNANTGCPFLDSKGIAAAETGISLYGKGDMFIRDKEIAKLCTEQCPYNKCVLVSKDSGPVKKPPPVVEEREYQCLSCKDIQRLTFRNGRLQKVRKFTQLGDKIIHLSQCGECRRVG